MMIQLNDILSVPDKCVEQTISLDFDSLNINGDECPIKDASEFELSLKNLGKQKLRYKLKGSFNIGVPCSRCLTEVLMPIEIDVAESVTVSDNHQDMDDVNYIHECQLDLKMLVFEEVSLALPMKILCKEDCLGICPVCGNNRNLKECDCNRQVPDPRIADALDKISNYF